MAASFAFLQDVPEVDPANPPPRQAFEDKVGNGDAGTVGAVRAVVKIEGMHRLLVRAARRSVNGCRSS